MCIDYPLHIYSPTILATPSSHNTEPDTEGNSIHTHWTNWSNRIRLEDLPPVIMLEGINYKKQVSKSISVPFFFNLTKPIYKMLENRGNI